MAKAKETAKAPLIYSKISKIMGKVGVITKNRKNVQQNYQFRGIDDMYNALNKHLSEEKVFYTSEVLESTREERQSRQGGALIYTIVRMKFTFYAEDGSNVTSIIEGEGMDSGDKSLNKAQSGALKYALMQIFCIPTDEPKDSENDSYEVKKKIAIKESYEELVGKLAQIKNKSIEEIDVYFKDNFDLNDKKQLEQVKLTLYKKINEK